MTETTYLGPVYTNAATTLALLFSLKTIEPLQNGVATIVSNEDIIASVITELSQH